MNLRVLWTISSSMGTAADIKMLREIRGGKIDVITADTVDKDSIGFLLTNSRYIIPEGSSPLYIERILDICRKEKITTVIPQTSSELVPLSLNLKSFKEQNIKVLVTEDTDKLKIANNKGKLYQYFCNTDFIPKYEFVHSIDEIEDAIHELGYPRMPVCLKPLDGEGGRGFWILSEDKMNIFGQKTGSLRMDWEIMKLQLQKSEKMPSLLVTEYLPGKEYSVDVVCKEGIIYACIPRQRVETCLGVATVSIIEKNDEIVRLSEKIISDLNLSYNNNLQFKYSYEGKPKLIEINPRVSGSLITNYGAGVNMLELSLRMAYNMPVGSIDISWGTKMIRFWDQVFIKEKGTV